MSVNVKARSYRFQVGIFECLSLSDGSWDYPAGNFFANVPSDQLLAALGQANMPVDYITTPYTYLYINTGEHRVLVDTGAGDLLGSRAGGLLDSMSTAGIDSQQIDAVVITHAHPDHIGGILDEAGRPLYTRARYHIAEAEWSFWFSETSTTKAPEQFVDIARRKLEPIRDRVVLIDGESEIVPGIHALEAPGHTPGHMVVKVSSGDALLLYIGDTVLHPLHLEHPDWLSIYDMVPEAAAASRRRIFDMAAAELALVVGQHLPPFPSLGRVVKNGKGWKWQPVEISATKQPLQAGPSGPTQTLHPEP